MTPLFSLNFSKVLKIYSLNLFVLLYNVEIKSFKLRKNFVFLVHAFYPYWRRGEVACEDGMTANGNKTLK